MPADTGVALARALEETLGDPAIRERLMAIDTFPGHEAPELFAASVATAQRAWIDIMAQTGVGPLAD
jgi:tripartite-type tricarboxylate transporter receptor subunit TctC